MAERLRGLLLERAGTTPEMLDAVLANRPASPLDALTRLTALEAFLALPDAAVLAAINKRIANILRKTSLDPAARVDEEGLTENAERSLYRVVRALQGPVGSAAAARRYAESLRALVALRAPVDEFFDRVMVMDEDPGRRNNRLALLTEVQRLLAHVADLSRLPG
jgi:glycyl-tRNA synthetase beta chain